MTAVVVGVVIMTISGYQTGPTLLGIILIIAGAASRVLAHGEAR